MAIPSLPRSRNDFHVALICALSLEAEYVELVLDKCWENEGHRYGKALGDQNAYTTGSIGEHNVVLVHLPGMGSTSAAAVAADLRSSFPVIKLALVVGICGAVPKHPKTQEEIALGDCIISTAVIQYDFGRQYADGFIRKTGVEDSLGRARPEIRALISKLITRLARQRLENRLNHHLVLLRRRADEAKYPALSQGYLNKLSSSYEHQSPHDENIKRQGHDDDDIKVSMEPDCDDYPLVDCEHAEKADPTSLTVSTTDVPKVHFGRFGSANTVMKSKEDRDLIAGTDEIVAFEMEGAGVWESFPTVIIKGVCDYADSHKNKVWQSYAAASAAACVKAFLEELAVIDLLASSISALDVFVDSQQPDEASNSIWHVPFRRKPGFVGRNEELQRTMSNISREEGGRLVSIVGLGGIGKSGLALEVAYRIQSEQPEYSVFWIQATDQSTFEKDTRDLAFKLGVPQVRDHDMDVKLLVKTRLSDPKYGRWLLIIDNADDEGLWTRLPNLDSQCSLSGYLPDVSHGFVVVTTRSRRIASGLAGKAVINLNLPSSNEAYEMLVNELEDVNVVADRCLTANLLERLGCLPLAIIQAASFLNMTQTTVQIYLELLDQPETEVINLLSEDFGDPTRYSNATNPVALTWFISFDQILSRNPLAAMYLSRMACLHDKNIPQSLLPEASSKLAAVHAVGVLTGYSLITKQSRTAVYSDVGELYDMHRLVHLATRNWLKIKQTFCSHIEESIAHLVKLFPSTDHKDKGKWSVYMPHSKRLCEEGVTRSFYLRYRLLELIGRCMITDGLYVQAVALFQEVADWAEIEIGLKNARTTIAFENLGEALNLSGDPRNAEKYLLLAIRSHEYDGVKGKLDISITRGKLASIFVEQGRLKEAEKLQLDVVDRRIRDLGSEYPATAKSQYDLVVIYQYQGRWQEAEDLALEVLKSELRLLGPEHPGTLQTQNNLATIYNGQGRWQEAENILRDVLNKRARILGPEHPHTLTCQNNLAHALWRQGNVHEAIDLLSRCVESQVRVLTIAHPDTKASSEALDKWKASLETTTQCPGLALLK